MPGVASRTVSVSLRVQRDAAKKFQVTPASIGAGGGGAGTGVGTGSGGHGLAIRRSCPSSVWLSLDGSTRPTTTSTNVTSQRAVAGRLSV